MSFILNRASIIALVAGVAAVSSAQSFTVATFADPTTSANQSMFTFQGTTSAFGNNGTLSGSYTGTGLTLLTPGWAAPDVSNARFTLGNSTLTGGVTVTNGTAGPGRIDFTTAAGALVLRVDFATAVYNVLSFGGSDLIGNNVTFSGPGIPGTWTAETFSFSFANHVDRGNNRLTMTGSFTSSAVPEPATLAALGLGAMALIRRRKSK